MTKNKPCKTVCRKSILVLSLFLSLTGIALAESTHKTSSCGTSSDCMLTVLKSFYTELTKSTSGIQFSVGP